MRNHPPPTLSFLQILVCIIALGAVAPVFAADIYKYVDDEGVPHYTDQWQMIPEKYRSSVQALDPATGKIFKPESGKAVPPAPQSSPQPPSARHDQTLSPAPAEPPFYAVWIENFSALSIPLPSRFQLGVGLMSAVLVWGAFKIIRVSDNLLIKLMLKGVIMIIIIGSVYSLYISNLNQRISEATRDTTPRSTSGKEVIQTIQGTTEKAKQSVIEKVTAPLEKVKDATFSEAIRTRDTMNQTNREKEKALQKIESGP